MLSMGLHRGKMEKRLKVAEICIYYLGNKRGLRGIMFQIEIYDLAKLTPEHVDKSGLHALEMALQSPYK